MGIKIVNTGKGLKITTSEEGIFTITKYTEEVSLKKLNPTKKTKEPRP